LDYGLCHLALIPLRKENDHKSEMVSQLLYGDCYKIIDKRKKWFKIRMEWDGYEGWITKPQIHQVSEEIYNEITSTDTIIARDIINYASNQDNLIFPILIGSDLRALKKLNHTFEGETNSPKPDKKKLSKTAFLYLNSPYLWGGRTPLGIDCSGFTQMVYKINGVKLSRDANQQANHGQTLSFIEESEAGDLAFFDDPDGKIVHVGLLLQDNHIIHAHGAVRIDRIDQSGIYNGETHTHNLRIIKKLI
tara:strand:+ start:374 stop:1117 length:744 start_codon:yes stop_codon:yes gene_type:complete